LGISNIKFLRAKLLYRSTAFFWVLSLAALFSYLLLYDLMLKALHEILTFKIYNSYIWTRHLFPRVCVAVRKPDCPPPPKKNLHPLTWIYLLLIYQYPSTLFEFSFHTYSFILTLRNKRTH
jgi:hypothetical protein